MDLVNLLSKLQAISETDKKADKDYDGDGKVESEKDEVWGSRMKAANKSSANEDIENVLRGLQSIQEADEKCPECGEVHEGECKEQVEECGEMPMMSPMSTVGDTDAMAAMIAPGIAADQMGTEPEAPAMAQPEPEEEPASYTLSIRNGDSTLNMTTDSPNEIIHVMKLAGVKGEATVKKGEQEVEEAWENTPAATNEKEPTAYGDIRDWGFKGTGKGKPGSALNKPAGSGDNPLSEVAMMEEYKSFKAGK